MRFRAASGRHQNCCTVFATFARLNHSGLITFYAEMGMFDSRSRRILQDSLPHRKSTQVRAVPERGNQGQTQHKGTAAGTAYAALVARRRSRRRLVSSTETRSHHVLRFFTTTQNLTRNRVSLFSFLRNRVSLFSFHRFHQN